MACSGSDGAVFTEVPSGNGASSTTAGNDGEAGSAVGQGGSLGKCGSSTSQGGANQQAGTGTTDGGEDPGTGGGSGGSATQGGNAGSSNNAGSTSGGTKVNAGSSGSGGSGGSAGTSGGGGGSGGSSAGACPDIFGDYDIVDTDGNCFNLNKGATQSITGTILQCLAQFVSPPQEGGRGVNGSGALNADGNFKGAVLSLNGVQRTNCSGSWDAVEERMTVQCGSNNEQCTVLLDLK